MPGSGGFALEVLPHMDKVTIETPVILAPMSGVTDLPFRRLARELGAGLVSSSTLELPRSKKTASTASWATDSR